jgi:hypothetical protein
MAPDALPLLWGGAVDQLESQSLSWPLPNRRPTLVLSRVAKCRRVCVCASTFTATAAVLSVWFVLSTQLRSPVFDGRVCRKESKPLARRRLFNVCRTKRIAVRRTERRCVSPRVLFFSFFSFWSSTRRTRGFCVDFFSDCILKELQLPSLPDHKC